ncbi:MAG: ATP-binding protein [Pyrobaculum sp.]
MKVGHVMAAATPFEFLATIDPESPVGLYEYVAVDHIDGGRLLGQIIRLYRDPYSLKKDLPLYYVMSEVSNNLLEVQVARVKILGYLDGGKLKLPKQPPRIGAAVYLAEDEEVAELYKVDNGLCVGKSIGREVEICLDLNGVRRHMAIMAATGSGKTWLSVVLIEELLKKGGKIVVFDPHGEYIPIRDTIHKLGPYEARVITVSERYPGDLRYKIGVLHSDPEALGDAAGVPPKATKIRYAIYLAQALAKRVREADGRPRGLAFMYKTLRAALGGGLRKYLSREVKNALEDDRRLDLLVEDLEALAQRDRHSVFSAVMYLKRLRRLGVFAPRSTPLSKLLADVTIVNLAGVRQEVQDYVVAHLTDRIFEARVRHVRSLKGEALPWPVVLFVEEAHRFAPPKTLKRTRAYEALSRVAAEGRKFGVFLVVISQRPSRVDPDVISQCQSQVVMRIINPKDQEAVRDSSEFMAQEFLENLPGLDVGEAVVLGPVVRLPAVVKVRDRALEYGGQDIDLAQEWQKARGQVGNMALYRVWREVFKSTPSPQVVLAAQALEVVSVSKDGAVAKVVLKDGGGKVVVTIEGGHVACSHCGVGRGCPHVYKAMEAAVDIICPQPGCR